MFELIVEPSVLPEPEISVPTVKLPLLFTAIKALDEVVACYHISGDYDYLIKVVTQDMESYRAFVVNKLTTISHVSQTHSSFVINLVKQSVGIKL